MKKLVIQSGCLKGKNVPAIEIDDKSNFTPALLKKSVFSIIASVTQENKNTDNIQIIPEEVVGRPPRQKPLLMVFIDFFGGSGQMGFEAASVGFEMIHILEIDNRRFKIIKEFTESIHRKISSKIYLHRKDAFRFFTEIPPDTLIVGFIDPPYSFWDDTTNPKSQDESQEDKHLKIKAMIESLIHKFSKKGKLLLIVQSPASKLKNFASRKIGNQFLLTYKSWLEE